MIQHNSLLWDHYVCFCGSFKRHAARKVTKFGLEFFFLVRIFPRPDWIWTITLQISLFVNSVNSDKTTGSDSILVEIIKLSTKGYHAKIANVKHIFKINEKTLVKNYPLVSLLNIFSKIYERPAHENLTPFVFFFRIYLSLTKNL